jgi:hypothetical protein
MLTFPLALVGSILGEVGSPHPQSQIRVGTDTLTGAASPGRVGIPGRVAPAGVRALQVDAAGSW